MEIRITINIVDGSEVDIPYIAQWITEDLLDEERFRSAVIEGNGETIEIVRRGD